MKEIISEELLSEVLGLDKNGYYPSKVAKVFIRNNEIIENWIREDNEVKINIHELAHECKEWALKKGYPILSVIRNTYTYSIFDPRMGHSFRADTEPQAIFKACQWIYDNKDK